MQKGCSRAVAYSPATRTADSRVNHQPAAAGTGQPGRALLLLLDSQRIAGDKSYSDATPEN